MFDRYKSTAIGNIVFNIIALVYGIYKTTR